MNRTEFFVALIGLSVLAAGCEKGSTAVIAPASVPTDAGARSAVIAQAQKQYLSIEAVAVSQVVDLLALPGRVTFRPQAQSAIGATTAGRVVAVLVQAGQVVKTGTELLTIESADAGSAPRWRPAAKRCWSSVSRPACRWSRRFRKAICAEFPSARKRAWNCRRSPPVSRHGSRISTLAWIRNRVAARCIWRLPSASMACGPECWPRLPCV